MNEVVAVSRLRTVPFLETSWQCWRDRGERLFLVGGFLRDLIMERTVPRKGIDIDLAATGDVLDTGRRLARTLRAGFVVLDDEHLTVRLVKNTRGERLCIDIARLRAASIEEDLQLRDFTVNALAVDLEQVFSGRIEAASIIDATGGLADLRARRLRQTGERTFPDDPLRTLRLFRLAAELGLCPETLTVDRAAANAASLGRISRERIRDELVKILSCRHSADALKQAAAAGVLAASLTMLDPAAVHRWVELVKVVEACQSKESSWRETVVRRLESYRRSSPVGDRPRTALVKLALLLGFSRAECVWESVRLAPRDIRDFLALARKETTALDRIIAGARFLGPVAGGSGLLHGGDPGRWLGPCSDVEPGHPSRRAVYRFFKAAGTEVPGALTAALALLDRDGDGQAEALLTDFWRENNPLTEVPRYLDGTELIQLGIPVGPQVGEVVAALDEAAAVGVVNSRDEAREWVDRYLREMP